MKKLTKVPKIIKIKVLAKDIKVGVSEDPKLCPIACAMKRTYGDDPNADIGFLEITIAGKRCIYVTPKKAEKFMNRFDDHKAVKPFSFSAKLEPEL